MNIIEKYYLWKARRRGAGAQDWPYRDVGLDKEGFLEMAAQESFLDWKTYWQAVRQLLRFDLGRNSWFGWRKPAYHLLCLIALLLGRAAGRDDETWKFDQIDSWGYNQLYAGWEAHFIEFNPRTFRYYIHKDGDWNM